MPQLALFALPCYSLVRESFSESEELLPMLTRPSLHSGGSNEGKDASSALALLQTLSGAPWPWKTAKGTASRSVGTALLSIAH